MECVSTIIILTGVFVDLLHALSLLALPNGCLVYCDGFSSLICCVCLLNKWLFVP